MGGWALPACTYFALRKVCVCRSHRYVNFEVEFFLMLTFGCMLGQYDLHAFLLPVWQSGTEFDIISVGCNWLVTTAA